MIVAALTDHRDEGFFVFKGGWEYVVFVALIALALAWVGPGRWSIDQAIGVDVNGVGWGLIAAFVGVISAALTLAVGRRRAADA